MFFQCEICDSPRAWPITFAGTMAFFICRRCETHIAYDAGCSNAMEQERLAIHLIECSRIRNSLIFTPQVEKFAIRS